MFQLKPSLHSFSADVFGNIQDLIAPSEPRERDTLMIACSDHGTAPDNVSFAGPDRFLILQHIGGSMPSKTESDEGEEKYDGLTIAPVVKTFDDYEFRHIIVCGHLNCKVIPNWMKPPLTGDRDFGGFRRRFAVQTQRAVDEHYQPESARDRQHLMICEHVLFQLENLLSHSFIMDRIADKRSFLHGWVVDDETARVFTYDDEAASFVRI